MRREVSRDGCIAITSERKAERVFLSIVASLFGSQEKTPERCQTLSELNSEAGKIAKSTEVV